MEEKRWKAGSAESFDEYWKTIEPRYSKRYSEGDTLQYFDYITLLGNTLVEDLVQQDGPCLSVELGCGRGDTSLFFAKRGWQALLLDLSQTALELARRNFLEEEVPCLPLRGDLLTAPFRDGSFQVVMNFGVLEHFEDPIQVLREMVRILKPGGALCVSVVYTRRVNLQTLVNWIYHIPGTAVRHAVLGRDTAKARQMIDVWRGRNFYENDLRMEDYVPEMRKLGLIEVRAIPLTTVPALRLPRFMEALYVLCIKAFCAIKWRLMGRHPLQAWWGGRCVWYFVGHKPNVGGETN